MQQASASIETKLPRALVRASAALKEKYGGPVNAKPEPDPPVAADAPAPNADTTVETPAPPAPASADPRENDPKYWQHRVSVMTGILKSERESRKAEVVALNRRITELQAELQAARDNAPEPEGDLGEFFTPEQIEEMGEDTARATYTAVKKQVKAALAAELKPLRETQAAAKANEQKDRDQAFTDRLAELVPEYVEIDASEEWGVWLAEENADGITRQLVLDRHVGARNAERVAKMFTEYQKSRARPAPPITPNGSGATPPAVPQKTSALTVPTTAEIKDFYKRSALRKVSPQETARFEERMALLKQ